MVLLQADDFITKMTKIAIAALFLFTGFNSAFAQNIQQQLTRSSVIEKIKKDGIIRIGLSLFRPWSMRDKNGELIGFELDVGRKLARDMEVEVEFIPTAWDGIIPALISGKFDVIISGMTITPQRNLTVDFSTPYAYAGMTILANVKLTNGFNLEDFNSPNITFSARRGGTPATKIADLFPKAKLLLFDEDGAADQEVINGNAHATMGQEPTLSELVRRYPDTLYIPVDHAFNAVGEAFAYRKGDPGATNFFNNWIGVNTRNGWLKQHSDYWFKSNQWYERMGTQ